MKAMRVVVRVLVAIALISGPFAARSFAQSAANSGQINQLLLAADAKAAK